jgi:hypothetical protein
MEHAEAQELLELAVAEPGGLDRLMGRGTPESAALAAHLQSCHECRADVEALRRSTATIRAAIRSAPSPDLRDRTLERVASMGRTRPEPVPVADVSPPDGRARGGWLPSAWTGRLAAGVAAAALILGIVAWTRIDARLSAADAAIAEQRQSVTGLTHTASWLMRVGAAPDSTAIQLAAAGDDSRTGTVLFSVDRGEIVMVANGLPALSAGQEYRCWMDDGSGRQGIGKMYVAGAVAYWGGELDALQGTAGNLAFGVSLVDESTAGLTGEVLLEGSSS